MKEVEEKKIFHRLRLLPLMVIKSTLDTFNVAYNGNHISNKITQIEECVQRACIMGSVEPFSFSHSIIHLLYFFDLVAQHQT